MIISIDTAIDPRNLGIACLSDDCHLTFPIATDEVVRRLTDFHREWRAADGGAREARIAAGSMAEFLTMQSPQYIVVDAPQAFSRPRRKRRAEQILRTSAWSGDDYQLPLGGFSGLALVRLGVELFNALEDRGYSRLTSPSVSASRLSIEVFPNASWHCFACDDRSIEFIRRLPWKFSINEERQPSTHDLDAAIGAITLWAARLGHGVFIGEPFRRTSDGYPREGFILIPNPAAVCGGLQSDQGEG